MLVLLGLRDAARLQSFQTDLNQVLSKLNFAHNLQAPQVDEKLLLLLLLLILQIGTCANGATKAETIDFSHEVMSDVCNGLVKGLHSASLETDAEGCHEKENEAEGRSA